MASRSFSEMVWSGVGVRGEKSLTAYELISKDVSGAERCNFPPGLQIPHPHFPHVILEHPSKPIILSYLLSTSQGYHIREYSYRGSRLDTRESDTASFVMHLYHMHAAFFTIIENRNPDCWRPTGPRDLGHDYQLCHVAKYKYIVHRPPFTY